MSQQQQPLSPKCVKFSKREFEGMQQKQETQKLREELAETKSHLDLANAELCQLKNASTSGSDARDGDADEQTDDSTSILLSNLIDDLIITCKTVQVPVSSMKPKLLKLDELFDDELDEQIKIARLLVNDINHELLAVFGRRGSDPLPKVSRVFSDI